MTKPLSDDELAAVRERDGWREAERDRLRVALENVLAWTRRLIKRGGNPHTLGFCEDVGVVSTVLREEVDGE